jgi:hypothetical protein
VSWSLRSLAGDIVARVVQVFSRKCRMKRDTLQHLSGLYLDNFPGTDISLVQKRLSVSFYR